MLERRITKRETVQQNKGDRGLNHTLLKKVHVFCPMLYLARNFGPRICHMQVISLIDCQILANKKKKVISSCKPGKNFNQGMIILLLIIIAYIFLDIHCLHIFGYSIYYHIRKNKFYWKAEEAIFLNFQHILRIDFEQIIPRK